MQTEVNNHQLLINRAMLETAFQQIGTDKIPYFIKIYLKTNSNFITKLQKYYQSASKDKLYTFVHKFKGSTANFYCQKIDNILLKLEENILADNQKQIKQYIEILNIIFSKFCQELQELADKY